MLDISITHATGRRDRTSYLQTDDGNAAQARTVLQARQRHRIPATHKLEHVAWLAWESRRHAMTVPTWEKFRDTLADIDFDTDNDIPLAEEAPPTS